ncbi:SCO family protein [Variovorax sp. dw_954]|uniref:SCO family protein n=1 Tax=Variovorax sp. dw_954 TaxID=2720078 RepID=UPI002116EBC8|nr:SCO family protein [Variovorax sp. dw_954]
MPFTTANAAPGCCCAARATHQPAIPPPVSGRFDLVDHFGRRVNERSFGSKHLLVFFGFSHCAVVCPRELSKLGEALAMLGPLADQVQALYVSVDPIRDTPGVLRTYLAQYRRFGDGFLGLTGTQEQAQEARKSFRVFAARQDEPDAPDGYVLSHTALCYFMAPGGTYQTHFADSLDAATVSTRMRRFLERPFHDFA